MSDFAWSGDDSDSVVLTWQPRTAIYETGGGGIAIRQEADGYSDDRDDQILLTPMGALQIAWRLIELAHEIGVPQPNRRLMAKPDLGPSSRPAPPEPDPDPTNLLSPLQEAAE
jgi:hypothetical protein